MRQLLATVFLMVSLAAHGAGVIPTLLTTNEPSGTPGTGKVLVATSARALAWTTSPVISGDVTAARFIGDGSLMTGLAGGGDVTTAQLNGASNVLWSAMLSLALEGSNNVAFRFSVLGTNTTNFSLLIGLAGSNYTATVSNTLASFISGLVTATTNGLFFEITNRLTPLSTAFLQVSNAHVALTNNFVLLSAGSLATSNQLTALAASSLLVSNAHMSLSNLFTALQTGSLSVSNAHIAVSNLLVALQTSYLVSSNDLRNLKAIQTNFYAGAGITFVVSDGTNVTIQSVGGTGIATNGGTGLNNFLTNLTTVGTQTNLGSGTSGRIDLGDTNGTVFVSLGSSGLNYSNAVFYLSTNGNGGFTTAIWVTTSNGGTNQFVPLSIGSGLSVDMAGRTLSVLGGTSGINTNSGSGSNNFLTQVTIKTGTIGVSNASPSMAAVLDANTNLASSTTTLAELAFVGGVTAAIQTQIIGLTNLANQKVVATNGPAYGLSLNGVTTNNGTWYNPGYTLLYSGTAGVTQTNVNVDFSTNSEFYLLLTNTARIIPINMRPNQVVNVEIWEDGTGGRNVSFDPLVTTNAGGINLTNTANARNLLTLKAGKYGTNVLAVMQAGFQ